MRAEDAFADVEKLPKPRAVEASRTDPEMAAALADGAALAIVPLVLDAALREWLGQWGRAEAANYDCRAVAPRLIGIYERVIAAAKAAPGGGS